MQNADDAHEITVLLQLKEFKQGALYRPSDEVFTIIQHVEQLFHLRTADSLMECTNAVKQLEEEAMLLHSSLPSCHDVKRKIISKYIRLRLRIAAKCIRAAGREDKSKGYLGSKSQYKKARKAQPTAPKAVTPRPLPNTLLIAMDVLGLSLPSQSQATTSIFLQPSVAHQQADTTSSFQLQPPPPATSSSLHQSLPDVPTTINSSIHHHQQRPPP